MKFKYLIDDIVINFLSYKNFVCMKKIRRNCNSIIDLSKFTFNKNILNEVVVIDYNQICNLTLLIKL